jgi:nucleoside-diphosphate-sugar epimerase
MKVLITGAAGMIGRKLTARLAADGHLGERPIERLILQDVVPPEPAGSASVHAFDLTDKGAVAHVLEGRPDVIYHLAAVLSGEAESDFDKGFRVNVEGTRALLEAIREIGDGYCPRVVFSSTIAVFGKPFPTTIGDDFLSAPLTSYGTEKAMCELMLSDYSRRGFVDGIGIRLPTICVRPGKPNKAASGFWSNIIREPLNGEEAILPVSEDVRHWFASPRSAIDFLVRAAALDTGQLGDRRNLSMPGLSVTVGEQIAALRRIAGDNVAGRIKREPDETIHRIIAGWPERFDPRRAIALGFRAESSFDEIIRIHIEDELGSEFAR